MSRATKVEVRDLTPELLDDYLRFFDKDAFTDFPEWSDCYCGFYDTPGDDWDASAKAGPAHRAARLGRVRPADNNYFTRLRCRARAPGLDAGNEQGGTALSS